MNVALPLYPIDSPLMLDAPESGSETRVELSAPATSVMTDFRVQVALHKTNGSFVW